MAERDQTDPSFGTYSLSPFLAGLRQFGNARGASFLDKRLASVIRKLLYMLTTAPYDVPVFERQKARLFPKTNRCEKRAFVGLSSWDAEERALIARDIHQADRDAGFVFLDCGANIGLYTLFARDEAQKTGTSFRALAIEPDPINQSRLAFNLHASEADDVALAPFAVGREEGQVRFISSVGNRGEARVADADSDQDTINVPVRPLANLVAEHQLTHIDVMKIDVEGHEIHVLEPYFETAPAKLWPQKILIEVGRDHTSAAMELCLARGYRVQEICKINVYLTLDTPVEGSLSGQTES